MVSLEGVEQSLATEEEVAAEKDSPATLEAEEVSEETSDPDSNNLRPKAKSREDAERLKRVDALVHEPRVFSELSEEERYAFATKYKDAGNTFFKEGKYQWAVDTYKETVTFVKHGVNIDSQGGNFSPTASKPNTSPEAEHIEMLCHLNSSACFHKLDNVDHALAAALVCLDLLEKHRGHENFKDMWSKAHFRAGDAAIKLKYYTDAVVHYQYAAEVSPDDKRITERLTRAKVLKKKEKEREIKAQKRLWGNKFKDGLGDDEVKAVTSSKLALNSLTKWVRQLLGRILWMVGWKYA